MGLSVTVLVLVLIAAVAWLGWQALQARDAIQAARPLVAQVQEQVTSGQGDAAAQTLTELQGHTDEARSNTHGPLWSLVAGLPAVGDDVRAVQAVTTIVDDVARDALPPLVEVAGSLDPAALAPKGGAIDLAPLQQAAPALERASTEMQVARAAVQKIDTTGVDERIAGPIADLKQQLTEAASTAVTGARAAALLPPMLGANEPRTYLVLFQNNAEVRATGGIPGATAVVRADQGRVEIVAQASSSDFPRFDEPVLPLEDDFVALHTTKPGIFVQDVNFTPDFPTSAVLAREMWRRVSGQQVDGVVSVDPVALSYLLEATGPLPLVTGEQISADNAVDLLLSDVYARFEDPRAQDAYFAAATASILGALTSGAGDPVAMLDQLARAAGEHRLLVWSAREEEQARLAGTVLEAALPTPDGRPEIGVYLNDGTEAKMSYYLRHEVEVVPTTCGADRPSYTVRVTMTSTAPPDAAATLPDYVLGASRGQVDKGVIRTQVLVYGPADGGVVTIRQDGEVARFITQVEKGSPVGSLVVDLAPGQQTVLEADVVGSPEDPRPPAIRTTPGVDAPTVTMVSPRCG